MINNYVHGYSERESKRLSDQANTLSDLIHHDSFFPKGSTVLEVGCGTGSQTQIIASQNPTCKFTSVDISEESLTVAKNRIIKAGLNNVNFIRTDICRDELLHSSYDHAVFCFVLEHLSRPVDVIRRVMALVKPGGTITAIEGDHGSVCFHPESKLAMRTIECQILLQNKAGGNANIGRTLYPLFVSTGLTDIIVSPRIVYVDASKPGLVEGFTKNTFIAMIEGVKDSAIDQGLISEAEWDCGIEDLKLSALSDGTFSYTFYKGIGINSGFKR